MTLKIGITHTETRYQNYPLWIKGNDSDLEIIELTPVNSDDLKQCDGIVLSGGVDTHPKFYKNERIKYPHSPNEFNVARDEFELTIFKFAQEKNIPVLAICRGMQLVNVAMGGDLIQDIEESGKQNHRRDIDTDRFHEITILKKSLMYEITGKERGIINSAHHQAIGKIADELIVTAFSLDGIAEVVERKNKKDKPFLLCVQFHPERLAEQQKDNPFTSPIRKAFLKSINQEKSYNKF